jgi:hypothetical protein
MYASGSITSDGMSSVMPFIIRHAIIQQHAMHEVSKLAVPIVALAALRYGKSRDAGVHL